MFRAVQSEILLADSLSRQPLSLVSKKSKQLILWGSESGVSAIQGPRVFIEVRKKLAGHEAYLRVHSGEASGSGRMSKRWKMAGPVWGKMGRNLGNIWKWQEVRATVLEVVGKRNEGGIKAGRSTPSYLRGLLKRTQELFTFWAMHSWEGFSRQGKYSLVMEVTCTQTLREQGNVRRVQMSGKGQLQGHRREAEIQCFLFPSSLMEIIVLFCFLFF